MSFFKAKFQEGMDSLKKIPAIEKSANPLDFAKKVVGHARAEVIGMFPAIPHTMRRRCSCRDLEKASGIPIVRLFGKGKEG